MDESSQPLFWDRNQQTGEMTPSSYESVRTAILQDHPLAPGLPDDIATHLDIAVSLVALAYEQANCGRLPLYAILTDAATVKAVLALELALRRRLRRGKRVKLEQLIDLGLEQGLMPAAGQAGATCHLLRDSRNQHVHGDLDRPTYGPMTIHVVWLVIDTVAGLGIEQAGIETAR